MTLRPYQEQVLEDLLRQLRAQVLVTGDAWRAGTGAHPASAVLQMATGAGKTHLASELIRRTLLGELQDLLPQVLGQPLRVQFWADLREITTDTMERLALSGLPVGVIAASAPPSLVRPDAPVQVVQQQTVLRRYKDRGELPPRPDLLILDEAHGCCADELDRGLRALDPLLLIGLTATPSRGDGRGLGRTFRSLVQGPQTAELQQSGHLVPCDVIAPSSGYLERGLALDPVEAYRQHCLPFTPEGDGGQFPRKSRALVFCGDGQARRTAEAFAAGDVPAEVLAADTRPALRTTQRARLQSGELLVLCTVDCAIKGWDCPAVDTVILARGVGVPGIYLQMVGRALRPDPSSGKRRARLIDLRGSCYLHGLPEEERVWSLGDEAVQLRTATAAYSRCGSCLWLGPARKAGSLCPRCQAPLGRPIKPPRVRRAQTLQRVQDLPLEQRRRKYEKGLRWQLQRSARGRGLPEHAVQTWVESKVRDQMSAWDRRQRGDR
jgi:superfamily II DNA or RNA helicase